MFGMFLYTIHAKSHFGPMLQLQTFAIIKMCNIYCTNVAYGQALFLITLWQGCHVGEWLLSP